MGLNSHSNRSMKDSIAERIQIMMARSRDDKGKN